MLPQPDPEIVGHVRQNKKRPAFAGQIRRGLLNSGGSKRSHDGVQQVVEFLEGLEVGVVLLDLLGGAEDRESQ